MITRVKATRPKRYKSLKRSAQAAESRKRILKALIAQLNEQGLGSFSVPKVARRADISLRTIYRHFPNRAALLEALSTEVESHKLARDPGLSFPESPSQLIELPFKLYPYYDKNASLIKARYYSELGRELRALVTPERRKMFDKVLKELTSSLSKQQAQQINALFHLLIGNTAWLHFRETWGLNDIEAAEISSWASRLILSELMRIKFDHFSPKSSSRRVPSSGVNIKAEIGYGPN